MATRPQCTISSEARDPELVERLENLKSCSHSFAALRTHNVWVATKIMMKRSKPLPSNDTWIIKDMPIACFLENKQRCTITLHVSSNDPVNVVIALALEMFAFEMKRRSHQAKDQILAGEPCLFKKVRKFWDADGQATGRPPEAAYLDENKTLVRLYIHAHL